MPITELLQRVHAGDQQALNASFRWRWPDERPRTQYFAEHHIDDDTRREVEAGQINDRADSPTLLIAFPSEFGPHRVAAKVLGMSEQHQRAQRRIVLVFGVSAPTDF